MDCDLIIFGGTGDLAKRSLLPALFNMRQRGELGANSRVISASRRPLSDDDYRQSVAPANPDPAWTQFARQLFHRAVDISAGKGFSALEETLDPSPDRKRLLYLSTLPEYFVSAVRGAHRAGLITANTSVIVEKPVGTDFESARLLNTALSEVFDEHQILRIDHYLGKARVRALESQNFAELTEGGSVQITLAESQDIGTRGEFYDRTGALRDMVQNHLLQLVCLVAADPGTNRNDVHRAKLEVLNALRLDDEPVWGQFDGYLDVDGVETDSLTETFVALNLRIDLDAWRGVPILLRTGKCMARKCSQVIVGNQVHDLSIAGENAYEALLGDALKGHSDKFVNREEVEAAWRFIDDLRLRRGSSVPVPYARGSWGPEASQQLAERVRSAWIEA